MEQIKKEKEKPDILAGKEKQRGEDAEWVVRTYADMVYRLAFARTGNRSDADDIFQEVFLRYVKSPPVCETEEHRKAWLLRVTVNCAGKFHRSFWQRFTGPMEEEGTWTQQEDRDLSTQLKKLPEKYRMVLHLFYYEELPVEKIAALTGAKQSTVRTQLTRARRALKRIMEEDGDA